MSNIRYMFLGDHKVPRSTEVLSECDIDAYV